MKNGVLAVILGATLLAGCSAVTTISTTQSGGSVSVYSSRETAVPRTETFSTTSFGNYDFKAEAPGFEPFYGLLPLKFNGGYLTLDILFFAPAAFFNLREVYPYYELDIEKKQVKYRKALTDEWTVFVPLQENVGHAKNRLGSQ